MYFLLMFIFPLFNKNVKVLSLSWPVNILRMIFVT